MQLIITLYLFDNETSMMIFFPQALGIGVSVWKLVQASEVHKTETFPYYRLADKVSYAQSETKRLDAEAMTYLSYALYPLLAIYAVYSAVYNDHKGWYSFVINTLVGAIYVYGFILMTPQLYINYRL